MFHLPFPRLLLMAEPLLLDEGRDGGAGVRGAEGRDGPTLVIWECPNGRGRWVSRWVAAGRLLS